MPASVRAVASPLDSVAILAATPLFSGLDETELRDLARQVDSVHLAGGETLMREGEAGDCLYVVVSGRLAVAVEDPDRGEVAVAEIGRGETVGEMAVLTGAARSATVRGLRDTILLRFSKASFDDLLERHPRTTMQLARIIVSRLEQSIHGRRASSVAPATIAVAPAGRNAPVGGVALVVAEQLARYGTTLHLSSDRIDETLMANDGDDSALIAWLYGQEAEHDYVVYECDNEPTPWTRRCLRQADRIVLAAHATGDVGLSKVEAVLLRQDDAQATARAELVLVHPASAHRPTRAAEWSAARRISAHHHIRERSKADAERLGRMLVGKGVGVVLSGGGARGFAHLGVLRALDECGVAIDAIGGTSMGAILGGLYACGYSHADRLELARKGFAENPPDADYTLPVVAIHNGQRGNAMLRSLYGEARIEDLWMRYFCVSTNLSRAETYVARDGPMWKWVRASCSAPGMAPPIFDGGDLHVDGGILDNLPVGVMRRTAGVGETVASDAGPATGAERELPAWDAVSGWGLLWHRLRGTQGAANIPNMAEILLRTATISSVPAGAEARRQADLYLHPPSAGVKITEWSGIDRAADAGYAYAIDRVREWTAARSRTT